MSEFFWETLFRLIDSMCTPSLVIFMFILVYLSEVCVGALVPRDVLLLLVIGWCVSCLRTG